MSTRGGIPCPIRKSPIMTHHDADSHHSQYALPTYSCMMPPLTHQEKEALRTRILLTIRQNLKE